MFNFILNSQILPYFGLAIEKKANMELNTGGELSPYFNIITSFKLLPYNTASDTEQYLATQIFHPKFNIKKLIDTCPLNQIWLIMAGLGRPPLDAGLGRPPLENTNKCVGYIGINKDNFINILNKFTLINFITKIN